MARLPRFFLYLFAIVLLATGLSVWLNPASAAAGVGLALPNRDGVSELRGFFGGSFVGLAVLLVAALRSRAAWGRGVLVSVAVVMVLMVVGRLVGAAADGLVPSSAGAGAAEALAALACWAVLRQTKESAQAV